MSRRRPESGRPAGLALAAALLPAAAATPAWADLTLLGSFDPDGNQPVDVGYSHLTDTVWVYDDFATEIDRV